MTSKELIKKIKKYPNATICIGNETVGEVVVKSADEDKVWIVVERSL